MRTFDLIQLLQDHPRKKLGFEYGEGALLRKDYHITEVKNVHIQATDCGGRQDSWTETVVQLWESPLENPEAPQMRVRKALQILDRVYQKQPLLGDSTLRFEYGNDRFHTSQLEVSGYRIATDELIVVLAPQHTTCKASDICGTPVTEDIDDTNCDPQAGCC